MKYIPSHVYQFHTKDAVYILILIIIIIMAILCVYLRGIVETHITKYLFSLNIMLICNYSHGKIKYRYEQLL